MIQLCFVQNTLSKITQKLKTTLFFGKKMSKDKLSFATGGMRNVKNVQSLYCLTHHIVNDSIYVLFPKITAKIF